MYKIYINNNLLMLCSKEELDNDPFHSKDSKSLRFNRRYIGEYVDSLEKSKEYSEIVLYHDDLSLCFKDFKTYFKIIKAAGGVVLNSKSDVLLIYRLGYWDLPKGKIEKGEKKKLAALREVREETGIKQLLLEKKLAKTYHVYRLKNRKKRILKQTHWYVMRSDDNKFEPQIEESITQVEWVSQDELHLRKPSYGNVEDVLEKVFS